VAADRTLCCDNREHEADRMGKGCILWAVGVPLPIILLLYFFNVL
jgi:hypothetical protein